ncbi:hypothetical protein BKA61DRAFT_640004 [Leptodontidium sp. MPI-SDFR-AT-0119]|nr:hypothetical protein BKA61DRAFT_640004 [Leptodontidium sp. MPI-SDFR-AT-0119]
MLSTLPLLNGRIALDRALENDDNILAQLGYPRQRQEFVSFLSAHKAEIEAIVSFHLCVKKCRASDVQTWLTGSYNVCIPVYISPPSSVRSVLVRIPLPYKVGEAQRPGNVDEKLRCEVASYLWIQEHCPDVPIPHLFGFGFPNGQSFTSPEKTPLFVRSIWCVRRTLLPWLRFPTPSRYISRRRQDTLRTGYMIISRVSQGKMLSDTWETFRHDKTHRSNLFHGLARIILSLNKTPLAAIGSLTFNDQGFTALTNRPLTLQLQSLENEGISTAISRRFTYSAQMAALTMMRAVLHHFSPRESRHGPFVFTLTDLHQSNIFVNDDWHITSIIDLEWSCFLPIQMQCPPYWLSGRAIDQMEPGPHLETFHQLVLEYLEAFEQETEVLENGSFWYFHAINSPKGLCRVFTDHVQRLFCPEHCEMRIFDQVVAPYWCVDASRVIERKIEEGERYKNQLREAFGAEVILPKA